MNVVIIKQSTRSMDNNLVPSQTITASSAISPVSNGQSNCSNHDGRLAEQSGNSTKKNIRSKGSNNNRKRNSVLEKSRSTMNIGSENEIASENRAGKKPFHASKKNGNHANRINDGRNEHLPKQPSDTINKASKAKRRNRNNKKNAKEKWWVCHIPDEAVDPITLDPLSSLRYPPFALVAVEPYVPISEWPETAAKESDKHISTEEENLIDRQRRILEEQWGSFASNPKLFERECQTKIKSNDDEEIVSASRPTETTSDDNDHEKTKTRHVNLFDGQALAYYMVSQLQFIDPFNRRDLTRDEIVNLDHYLRRHGFGNNLNVTEAYDTKGVTISTAGAIGNTAAGRVAILQQEAQNLLNSLFRGSSVRIPTRTTQPALERRRQQQQRQRQQQPNQRIQHPIQSHDQNEDVSVEVETNPILEQYRANERMILQHYGQQQQRLLNNLQNSSNVGNSNRPVVNRSFAVASGSQTTPNGDTDFPSLAVSAVAPISSAAIPAKEPNSKKKTLPVSKTLATIGSFVKKTDPAEVQRQREARDLALKKAMLSNLTFGSNPVAINMMQQLASTSVVVDSYDRQATEQQIERNRILAEAFDVKPAGLRHNPHLAGWARPITGAASTTSDEYGAELITTIYPNDLIRKSRDFMTSITKLESKWITFLQDDKAASLPLNNMHKPLRAIVHEYASYWQLHTESFDPEPRRYIHCVKLRETRAPYPLLSQAVQSWNGPGPIITSLMPPPSLNAPPGLELQLEHSAVQTAGQSTRGREIIADERKPISLLPRSSDIAAITQGMEGFSIGGAQKRSMTNPQIDPSESRFAILTLGRDRPKLELQPRTLPLSVQHQTDTPFFDISEDMARARDRSKKQIHDVRKKEENKRRALEAAFASDDEEEDDVNSNCRGIRKNQNTHNFSGTDDDDDDWGAQVAVYQGSDDE